MLKLFEGARVAHPAAALAAWKTAAARQGDALGKPLEAVIAFFNPEMATEWRTLHQAELVVNWDQTHDRAGWHAIVPRDDGTLAAGITASRLSDGGDDAPVDFMGQKIAVARLGRPGSALAAQRGDASVFGTTRDELLKAVEHRSAARQFPSRTSHSNRASASCSTLIACRSASPARCRCGSRASCSAGFRAAASMGRCRSAAGRLDLRSPRICMPTARAFTVLDPLGFDRSLLARIDTSGGCRRGFFAGR